MKAAKFTEQELDDILSSLSFFIREYPNDGARETKRDMKKLMDKIWKIKKRNT